MADHIVKSICEQFCDFVATDKKEGYYECPNPFIIEFLFDENLVGIFRSILLSSLYNNINIHLKNNGYNLGVVVGVYKTEIIIGIKDSLREFTITGDELIMLIIKLIVTVPEFQNELITNDNIFDMIYVLQTKFIPCWLRNKSFSDSLITYENNCMSFDGCDYDDPVQLIMDYYITMKTMEERKHKSKSVCK